MIRILHGSVSRLVNEIFCFRTLAEVVCNQALSATAPAMRGYNWFLDLYNALSFLVTANLLSRQLVESKAEPARILPLILPPESTPFSLAYNAESLLLPETCMVRLLYATELQGKYSAVGAYIFKDPKHADSADAWFRRAIATSNTLTVYASVNTGLAESKEGHGLRRDLMDAALELATKFVQWSGDVSKPLKDEAMIAMREWFRMVGNDTSFPFNRSAVSAMCTRRAEYLDYLSNIRSLSQSLTEQLLPDDLLAIKPSKTAVPERLHRQFIEDLLFILYGEGSEGGELARAQASSTKRPPALPAPQTPATTIMLMCSTLLSVPEQQRVLLMQRVVSRVFARLCERMFRDAMDDVARLGYSRPCEHKWALVAFGSLARQEMCPFRYA